MKDNNTGSIVMDSLPLSCSYGPKQMSSGGSFTGLNEFQLAAMKNFNKSSVSATLPVKKKNPLIQVCLDASGNTRDCLDPIIDDLDVTYIPTLNLSVGIHKQTKRPKGPSLLTVDTDKKKEVITQVYKNLYGRNFEVEKTITGFYFKNLQEGKITYTAHVANKKGDAFLDEYTVDYFEKFYSNFVPKETNNKDQNTTTSQVPPPESASSSFNSSQIKKVRKQLKTPSAVPIEKGAGVRRSKRPSTALIIKSTLRSSSSNLSPGHKPLPKEADEVVPEMNLNDAVIEGTVNVVAEENKNKKEEEEPVHNIVRKTSKTRKKPVDFSKMESALGNFLEGSAFPIPSENTVIIEQGDNERSEKMLYAPDTENHFRILKVANFLHKVSPIKTIEKEQLRLKGVDESRNISPIVTNLLGKLYSTSTKTQGSDEEDNNSRTPTNSNNPPNFIRGQYYVKKPNGREEDLAVEKSASISITKIKPNTPNLNVLYNEQKKIPPSMDRKLSKDSKSSPTHQVMYKSVKFPEVSMSRKASREKSLMMLEIDNSSKVVLVQRNKSIENEKKLVRSNGSIPGEEGESPKRREGMGVVEVQFEGKGNMVADVRKHLRRVKTSQQNGVRG